MSVLLLVGIVFIVIMIAFVVGTVFFVKFHLQRRRENRPLSPVLKEALTPYGFQPKYLGSGAKWIGQINGFGFQVYDLPSISGGLSPGSPSVRSKASAALFRIHVFIKPGKPSQSNDQDVFHKIDSENASSVIPGTEAAEVLNRLVQPPALTPMAFSRNEIQLRLDPDEIRAEQLQAILGDLARLADIIQKQ